MRRFTLICGTNNQGKSTLNDLLVVKDVKGVVVRDQEVVVVRVIPVFVWINFIYAVPRSRI